MSKREALYQSLASCGAVLIAFIGLAHEVDGHILFPWAPAAVGGPIGWHSIGISGIVLGLLLLGGTLRLIRFPVVPLALAAAAAGIAVGIFTAVVHHQLHMFAFSVFAAGITTAFFHRRAAAERRRTA